MILLLVASIIGLIALTDQGNKSPALGGANSSVTSNGASASCPSLSGTAKSNLTSVHFDAVTKFMLPSPARSPNAITVANDGSVWFGEQAVPGVGHLYQNGTLVEYRWPFNYTSPASSCSDRSDIWGIALWDGMVWASDNFKSQLVGLNPSTVAFETIPLTRGSFPYTLVVGPDNNLWFTELSYPATIGRINQASRQIQHYPLPDGKNASSAYLTFSNDTLAYVLTISPLNGTGRLFSFDPASLSPTFSEVKGTNTLYSPTSTAIGEGGIWLTQHSSSAMAYYNVGAKKWEVYPTSRVNYTLTTLTYFDVANGSTVWFNEHYGNKLGTICCNGTKLTEYSFSNPPARNGSLIDNALTIARAADRVWFTEWTANYVGFVSTLYRPTFSVSTSNQTLQLKPGQEVNIKVRLVGNYSSPLSIRFSDSESFSSAPKDINMTASPVGVPFLHGEKSIAVTVEAGKSLVPGDYRLLITVDGGLVLESIYVMLHVLP